MLVVLWVLVPSREISMQMFPFDAIANFHVMASLNVPVFRETGASCQRTKENVSFLITFLWAQTKTFRDCINRLLTDRSNALHVFRPPTSCASTSEKSYLWGQFWQSISFNLFCFWSNKLNRHSSKKFSVHFNLKWKCIVPIIFPSWANAKSKR